MGRGGGVLISSIDTQQKGQRFKSDKLLISLLALSFVNLYFSSPIEPEKFKKGYKEASFN